MTKEEIKKVIEYHNFKYDCSGGNQPIRYIHNNFAINFNCKDSHDISTCNKIVLELRRFDFDTIHHITIIECEFPTDLILLDALMFKIKHLIKTNF